VRTPSTSGRNQAVFRAVAALAVLGAIAFGALMAVRSRGLDAALARLGLAPRGGPRVQHDSARSRVARVIAARDRDGGVHPVATVLSPAGNGDAGARRWPPALLNPEGHLRTAWELSLGRPGSREVLFTFDDGPKPGTTDRLLDILDRHRVKAVFYVCGWRLETDSEPTRGRARAILREAFRRGHVIGNHSMTHPNMANLSRERVEREVERTSEVIASVIGQRPHLFRPPYGSYSDEVQRHVQAKGYELSLWSIDSHDWQMVGDAEGVAMNVIRLLGNMAGGTILLHDTHPWSVRAADMVLRWLATENRERADAGRAVYRIVDAAEFIEGARERLPSILAGRAEADARDRRRRREGDAGEAPGEAANGAAANGAAANGAAADAGEASGAAVNGAAVSGGRDAAARASEERAGEGRAGEGRAGASSETGTAGMGGGPDERAADRGSPDGG
jgi:peptidoglycan/xylan/chitin deacetylase (PgdA/CDA1 family)